MVLHSRYSHTLYTFVIASSSCTTELNDALLNLCLCSHYFKDDVLHVFKNFDNVPHAFNLTIIICPWFTQNQPCEIIRFSQTYLF